MTGGPPPLPSEEAYSPIPVEKDAAEFVTERLDRLIDALGATGAAGAMETIWSPPMTVWEDADHLMVCLDMAGVDRKDLKVSEDGESLSVSGLRAATQDGMSLRMSERPLGPFRRKILLPRRAAGAELTARLHDGILEIRIPRPKVGVAGSRPLRIA